MPDAHRICPSDGKLRLCIAKLQLINSMLAMLNVMNCNCFTRNVINFILFAFQNYNEREKGRLVVYVTSMGVVRDTFQRCQKVKQILRTLLVKFDERDCYMNRSIQDEIRERLQHQNNNNLTVAAASSSALTASSTQNGKKKPNTGISLSSPPSSHLEKQLLNKTTKSSININIAGATSFCTNSSATSPSVNHSNNHHNSHNKNNLPINFISLPQVFLEGQHLGVRKLVK